MQLIFINRFFWPDQSATSQMLTDLAFALAAGKQRPVHPVTVITSRLNFEDAGARLKAREVHEGVHILRVWTSSFGRYNLLGRLIDYLTFYISATIMLLLTARRGDVVVTKTDPPMLSVLTTPTARLRGARPVNWLQDVYPEVATALGVKFGPLEPALRWLRNRSLNAAAANVVLGDRMEQLVSVITGNCVTNAVIPNWADGKMIYPVPRDINELRRSWGLEGKFVIGYSGNLGRAHDRTTMLDAISAVEQLSADKVRWLFIGAGAQLRELKAEVEDRGLRSVLFRPYQPREVLSQSLSAADLHLVSLRPELEGLIVPSKIYGILAVGRPAIFIGDPNGEVGRLLAHAGCGVTVAQGDTKALADCILLWSSTPEVIDEMAGKARDLFNSTYDFRLAVGRWQDFLSRLNDK